MSWNRKTRSRATWMWLAIAAVAFTSVAHAEPGLQTSKGYSHPVFEFLARSHAHNQGAHPAALRFTGIGSRLQANSMLRNGGPGPLIAMLPVLFIGLVSPFKLASAGPVRSHGRPPASPLLSALFQRPPPSVG